MSGYNQQLYILPFDQRGTLIKIFFGQTGKLEEKQKKELRECKKIIFEAFLKVYRTSDIKNNLAIMVDEEFGAEIIAKSLKKGIKTFLPVEKSGQKLFTFEQGGKFGQKILAIKPSAVKALVRYNPGDKEGEKIKQLARLKRLSSWCAKNNFLLMIELLVPPIREEAVKKNFREEIFDRNRRPALTVRAVKEFYQYGIQTDIWKIEAQEKAESWPELIRTIRGNEPRKDTGIIMLGRGASFAKVKEWFQAAPRDQLNGFAVGRTIFMRALEEWRSGKIKRSQAVGIIAANFAELIRAWRE